MTNQEEFIVEGMTGVDLTLQVAGPGSRSYAFIIDWHIRLLMALAYLLVSMLVVYGGLRIKPNAGPWAEFLIVGPPIIIYFLYHPIVELLMRGQTPGKRMAGVRVVNRDGSPPSAGAILARNAFRLIDSMPMLYLVGLVCTFITAQRVRIGDLAAGTLLITHDTAAGKALDRLPAGASASGLDPAAQDVAEQLLERWGQLGKDKRGQIARTLLQRIDPQPLAAEVPDAELRERLQTLASNRSSR